MSRQRITKMLVHEFMAEVSKVVHRPTRLYLAGGSTAVLLGFREGTIDIDIAGEMDEIFSAIPGIKARLDINIELAKPTDFVPSLAGETERHLFIATCGKATFMHFDPYGQAFAKIVRGHETDISDARNLIREGLVTPAKLLELVREVTDGHFARYPRLNRESVELAVSSFARTRI